jgi:asparagine synthase (glutamine-hydrolysing)
MCAISGIVNLDPQRPVDPATLDRMTDIMSHRGPDGRGTFIDGNAGLGHRRLSIIDLAGGAQPMFNEDESVVTVFNGEIYNYGDLTSDLVARGHRFRTHSDTETIVHAYEEYGKSCLERFRGMFAIALWDTKRRKLLLARDRLGIKPVYYYHGQGFLAFASEIKALLEIPEVPREVDLDALSLYTSLRYVPGPRTMFRNIFKLQPGHCLTLDQYGVSIRKYWDMEFHPRADDEEELLSRFDSVLSESVRLRLVADVPLGVFLSGGLDSSSILAVMSELRRSQGINTFSVGYEEVSGQEAESNEFEFARMAADAFGSKHHECRIGPRDVQDILPQIVWHLDEPLADPSCIPLYFVSKAAREDITVVLSGEGADEVFGGYSIYHRMLQMENLYRLGGRLLGPLAPLARPLVPGERNRAAFDGITTSLEERYRGVSRAFRPEMKRRLLPWDESRHGDELIAGLFESSFHAAGRTTPLNRMLYVDTHIWLPDDLLLKADKITMANQLELRVPFLDHRMVEFASGLPQTAKLRGKTGKALLRRLMKRKLPAPILSRGKKGFPVPTSAWLRTELQDWVKDSLLSSNSATRHLMNPDVVKQVVGDHLDGRVNREQELWTLLVFDAWYRTFMKGDVVPARRTAEFITVGAR